MSGIPFLKDRGYDGGIIGNATHFARIIRSGQPGWFETLGLHVIWFTPDDLQRNQDPSIEWFDHLGIMPFDVIQIYHATKYRYDPDLMGPPDFTLLVPPKE